MIDELHVFSYRSIEVYKVGEHLVVEISCEFEESEGFYYSITYREGKKEIVKGFQFREVHLNKG